MVVQVNPGLLRLLLLKELVGVDPPLPSLLRLRASKPHLEGNTCVKTQKLWPFVGT